MIYQNHKHSKIISYTYPTKCNCFKMQKSLYSTKWVGGILLSPTVNTTLLYDIFLLFIKWQRLKKMLFPLLYILAKNHIIYLWLNIFVLGIRWFIIKLELLKQNVPIVESLTSRKIIHKPLLVNI